MTQRYLGEETGKRRKECCSVNHERIAEEIQEARLVVEPGKHDWKGSAGAGAVFWSLTSEGPDLAQLNFDSLCSSPSPFLLFIPSVLSLLLHRLT